MAGGAHRARPGSRPDSRKDSRSRAGSDSRGRPDPAAGPAPPGRRQRLRGWAPLGGGRRGLPLRASPPGQSQDPGHVARLPAGVRRGAGPERRLKGAAPAPGHPVGHLSALTARSSPPHLHGPETAARGETPRHKHDCKGDFALGSQPLRPVDSAPSSAWARSTHLRVKTPLASWTGFPEPTHHREG